MYAFVRLIYRASNWLIFAFIDVVILCYVYNLPMKTTVVSRACLYLPMPHWHVMLMGSTDKIIISMLSAIQHSPTTMDNRIWKRPKPIELTAWVTVKVSSGTGTTPLKYIKNINDHISVFSCL